MRINNLSTKVQKYESELLAAAARVIHSGWWIQGDELTGFEITFSKYLGVNYCIGVANGTDALELAMRAAGIQAGYTVATVANAGMYTSKAILAIGAHPFYIDIDARTYNTTLEEIKKAVDAGVNAVVVTHLYGQAVFDIPEISRYCVERHIPLIEDCAQAHGASIDGQRVGTFGTAAAFSFYPTKNLGALGDGGAVVTQAVEISEKIKCLRQYGWSAKYQVDVPGGRNSRLDELQAAFLSVMLPCLDHENAERQYISYRYSTEITHPDIVLPVKADAGNVVHLYVIRTSRREALKSFLQTKGIFTEVHYPIPDYRQAIMPASYENFKLENTERHCAEILTLPCFPGMKEEEIDQVVRAINSWDA